MIHIDQGSLLAIPWLMLKAPGCTDRWGCDADEMVTMRRRFVDDPDDDMTLWC